MQPLNILNYILLFAIGLWIYAKRRRWVALFWLCIIPVFFPFSVYLTRSFSWESFTQLRYQMVDFGKYYIAVLVVFRLLTKPLPNLKYVYLFTFLWLFYYLIDSFFIHRGCDLVVFRTTITEIFSQILLFLYIIQHKKWLPTYKDVIATLLFLIFLQFGICILQFMHIYIFYPCYYLPQFINTIWGVQGYNDDSLLTGTFFRYNAMTNFMTTAYLFIAMEYYSNNAIRKKTFFSLSIVIFVCILMSGAKASLALFFFILCASIFIYGKRHRGAFISALIVGLVFYLSIPLIITKDIDTGYIGLDRMINGWISVFEDSARSGSTSSLSFYLLENFFDINPLFGAGYSYKGELGYGNVGICTLTSFNSDAKLAYIIVEVGLIGLLLYILVFSAIFKVCFRYCPNKEHIKIWVCIVYYILLNITESGVFERICFPMVFIYVFCMLSKKVSKM